MEEMQKWHRELLIRKTVDALRANFFEAKAFDDRQALTAEVLQSVGPGMTVGFGGSLTVRSLGLVDLVKERGATAIDHWQLGLSKEEIHDLRVRQLTCDLFLTGTNAVTEGGELVNMDGMGNRVNAMTFGPKKVIVIAGSNKIVADVHEGIERIKKVAAPMNARRLNLPLPCAESGRCHNCKSEQRICRILSILEKKPGGTNFSVFFLNEDLGL